MRFVQIVTAGPEHLARTTEASKEEIAAGTRLATGGIGQRAALAARVTKRNGEVVVEDPPHGDRWMAAGGYVVDYDSKDAAIAQAKTTLELLGEGVVELIQVTEMPPEPPMREGPPVRPLGVVPYLTVDGASAAAAFYAKAFGAKEIHRMPSRDGKRLMHCHLEINGGALMIADNFPELGHAPIQRSSSYTMHLVVAEGDAWWKRAIEAGCKEKIPFARAPWGDKYGQLTDPSGVTWALNSPGPAQRPNALDRTYLPQLADERSGSVPWITDTHDWFRHEKARMVHAALWNNRLARVDGDYLEFGVFEGVTFLETWHAAQGLGMNGMRFHAFDSFEGLPPLTAGDAESPYYEKMCFCPREVFETNLERHSVDRTRVTVTQGWFDQSLTAENKKKIGLTGAAIAWIDCDLYESTVPVLDYLTDVLVDGAVLVFDDWFGYKGHTDRGEARACAEWLARNPGIRLVEFQPLHCIGKSFIVLR